MKQNVDISCSTRQYSTQTEYYSIAAYFPFEPLEKCTTFKDIFPGLSSTLSFNFQDFPGPKWFPRTFQVLEFSRQERQQRRHSKMEVSRHLGYDRTGNSTIRSADPENPCLKPDMEWIGCTFGDIFAFELYCDLETWVRGHSRSSKVALFDRAHATLYSSSIVTMPLSLTVSEI